MEWWFLFECRGDFFLNVDIYLLQWYNLKKYIDLPPFTDLLYTMCDWLEDFYIFFGCRFFEITMLLCVYSLHLKICSRYGCFWLDFGYSFCLQNPKAQPKYPKVICAFVQKQLWSSKNPKAPSLLLSLAFGEKITHLSLVIKDNGLSVFHSTRAAPSSTSSHPSAVGTPSSGAPPLQRASPLLVALPSAPISSASSYLVPASSPIPMLPIPVRVRETKEMTR